MTPEERAHYLDRLVGAWCPHDPTPKQEFALRRFEIEEIFFGGAAGGGKSDWLLMEAARYVDVPGYAAIIFRRTSPQLHQAGGMVPRSKEWWATTPAVWSAQHLTWTFPSGATIRFAHLQHEDTKHDHQGGEYQFIGWDELTHFSKSQYLYLQSRLRQPEDAKLELADLPLRIRATSNPGGEGHEWVHERFVKAATPLSVFDVPPEGDADDEEDEPARAMFVPSLLHENPYVNQRSYRRQLKKLPLYEQKQLLEGDWNIAPEGAIFKRAWFKIVPDPPVFVRARVRSWDIAASAEKPGADPDYTVGTLMSADKDGGVYVEDVVRDRRLPGGVDEMMLECAQRDGPAVPIIIEQQPAAAGKIADEHFRKLLMGYDVRFRRIHGDKKVRANPFASYAQNGAAAGRPIHLVDAAWNSPWFSEVCMFTGTKNDPHDDQVDSASQAFAELALVGGSSWEDIFAYEDAVKESA